MDITHVSEGRDEALLVFHLQLVVLLVLPPPADIVEEGPDVMVDVSWNSLILLSNSIMFPSLTKLI